MLLLFLLEICHHYESKLKSSRFLQEGFTKKNSDVETFASESG